MTKPIIDNGNNKFKDDDEETQKTPIKIGETVRIEIGNGRAGRITRLAKGNKLLATKLKYTVCCINDWSMKKALTRHMTVEVF